MRVRVGFVVRRHVCVIVVMCVDGTVVVCVAGVVRIAAVVSIFWRGVTILGAVIVIANIGDSASGARFRFIRQRVLRAMACVGCGVAFVHGWMRMRHARVVRLAVNVVHAT